MMGRDEKDQGQLFYAFNRSIIWHFLNERLWLATTIVTIGLVSETGIHCPSSEPVVYTSWM